MKVLLAPDSFKGTLSAHAAAEAIAAGLGAALPSAELILRPLADGGDGTGDVLRESLSGEWREAVVTGPLADMRVAARYLWLEGPPSGALVEMAEASGLVLLEPARRNPLATTTRGTGELLARAAAEGAARVWLTLGGSATVDGGVGAAAALGWRFLDETGIDVAPGGGSLERIRRLVPPPRPVLPPCDVLCDVDNPLLGERGAARVFGPQKGATPAVVAQLESGLSHLAELIESQLGCDVRDLAGAGAAGGFGAGAVAFLGAHLERGAARVADLVGLDDCLADADWVVTGEGRYDEQSRFGKVVSEVALRAARHGVRVAILAGTIAGERGGRPEDADLLLAAAPPGSVPPTPEQAAVELEHAARGLGVRLAAML